MLLIAINDGDGDIFAAKTKTLFSFLIALIAVKIDFANNLMRTLYCWGKGEIEKAERLKNEGDDGGSGKPPFSKKITLPEKYKNKNSHPITFFKSGALLHNAINEQPKASQSSPPIFYKIF